MSLSLRLYGIAESIFSRHLTWRVGRWLYLGARHELAADPNENGEYALMDWTLAALAKRRASAGCFVDIGANLGEWTGTLAAKLAAKPLDAFVIHAFEPAPSQRQLLKTRVAGRPADRIVVDDRGVTDRTGVAQFALTGETTGTNSLDVRGHAAVATGIIEVQVTTLDAVAEERGYAHIDLVKVDTEGNDFNVIVGSRALFDREAISVFQFEYNQCWIEFRYALMDVFRFLEGRPYVLGRLTQKGVEVYNGWHAELDRYIQTNYVIVHKDALGSLPHWIATFGLANTAETQ